MFKRKEIPMATLTDKQCREIAARADAAGREAAAARTPTPMIVTGRVNPLDDTSKIQEQYYVADGVCGFAYVTVKPGNSKFAKFVKKELGGFNAYYGGVQFSVHSYNQSMELKAAYASAYAKVLQDNGIKAYSESRMD